MGRLGLLVVVCVVGSSFASPLTAAAQSDALLVMIKIPSSLFSSEVSVPLKS